MFISAVYSFLFYCTGLFLLMIFCSPKLNLFGKCRKSNRIIYLKYKLSLLPLQKLFIITKKKKNHAEPKPVYHFHLVTETPVYHTCYKSYAELTFLHRHIPKEHVLAVTFRKHHPKAGSTP